MEFFCVDCENPLYEIPIFNNGDIKYPESFLFCGNPKCKRHGVLTVTFKSIKEKSVKGKRKTV
jgi:hypothetical protein